MSRVSEFRASDAPLPVAPAPPALIDIVLPAYNEACFIADAIRSVRAQSVTSWRLIVVDDGSDDDTSAVAANAAGSDPRVSILRKENGGLSAARNTGIAAATSPWLAFLDADDWWDPAFLERLLAAGRSGVDVVVCHAVGVDDSGRTLRTYETPDLAEPYALLAETCPFTPHSLIVRRGIIQALGGFDVTLRACEDWDMWLRIARTGARFCVHPEALAFYRHRAGSMSRDATSMIEALARVMRQAFGPDPRVQTPAAHLADGADRSRFALALSRAVFHRVGVGLGAGQTPVAAWDYLADQDGLPMSPALLGSMMADAAEIGLVRPRGETGDGWADLCARTREFLLSARSAMPHAVRALALAHFEAAFQRERAFDPSSARIQDGVVTRRIDLSRDMPTLDLSQAQAAVCAVLARGRWVGVVECAGGSCVAPAALWSMLAGQSCDWDVKLVAAAVAPHAPAPFAAAFLQGLTGFRGDPGQTGGPGEAGRSAGRGGAQDAPLKSRVIAALHGANRTVLQRLAHRPAGGQAH